VLWVLFGVMYDPEGINTIFIIFNTAINVNRCTDIENEPPLHSSELLSYLEFNSEFMSLDVEYLKA